MTIDVTYGDTIYHVEFGDQVVEVDLIAEGNLSRRFDAVLAALLASPGLTLQSPSFDTSLAVVSAVDDAGNQLPILRTDGRLLQTMADGSIEPAMSHSVFYGEDLPMIGLIEGERPWAARLGADDAVIEAWTYEGSYFVVVDGVLTRANDTAPQSVAPVLPLIGGEIAIWAELGDQDQILRALTADGSFWVAGLDGLVLVAAPPAVAVGTAMPTLVGGERIRLALVDGDDCIYECWTEDDGHWTASPTGLRRSRPPVVEPASYTQLPWFNGGPAPIAVPDDPNHWFLFLSTGQSGAEGLNDLGATDPLVASTSVYPYLAFMFSGGTRRNVFGRDDNAVDRTLVPLIESTPYPTLRETRLSGFATHFLRALADAQGPSLLIDPSPVPRFAADDGAKQLPKVLGVVCALGARPYMALNRGSTTWRNLTKTIDDAVAAMRAAGATKITTIVSWDQGNNDLFLPDMTSPRYLAQLKQYQRQLGAAIMERTGEIEDPIFLITQQGETTAQNGDPFDVPVPIAELAADGVGGMRLSHSAYWLPHTGGPHPTCIGQNYQGQREALAAIEELFGCGWRPIKPIRWWWSSPTVFKIEFDLPRGGAGLTLDTSGTWITMAGLANHGFAFDDASGAAPAISSVAAAGRIVTITLASAPTGLRRRWRYAMDRNAGTTANGPVTGGRGTLRDTAGSVNAYNGVTIYNWCPAFVIDAANP